MIIQKPYGPTPNPSSLNQAQRKMFEAVTEPMNIRGVMKAMRIAAPSVVVMLAKKLSAKGFLEICY